MVGSPLSAATKLVMSFLIALTVASCGPSNKPEGEEVSRSAQPRGRAVAIITKIDGGVTVSMGYRVYIQGTDGILSEVLRMDRGDAPRLAWSANTLKISAMCGQIYAFKNFAVVDLVADPTKVSVLLENQGLCDE